MIDSHGNKVREGDLLRLGPFKYKVLAAKEGYLFTSVVSYNNTPTSGTTSGLTEAEVSNGEVVDRVENPEEYI